MHVVHDYFKGALAQKRGAGQAHEPLFESTAGDALTATGSSTSAEREILLSQIDAVLQRELDPATRDRDRKVFWLYYRSGLTASNIASLPGMGLGVKGVESLLLRLTRLVRLSLLGPGARSEPGQVRGFPTTESL